MAKYVIALDQGTTSSRAIAFDKAGNIIAKAQNEFDQIYPQAGWVEHDPMKILYSQLQSLTSIMAEGTVSADDIAAIGITNQRETTILWNKETGKPVYNAIVWQCRRTADICEKLIEEGLSDYIQEHTGLISGYLPMFPRRVSLPTKESSSSARLRPGLYGTLRAARHSATRQFT